jgi:fucose 4-O-acetylase-like acetyltransferase
MDKFLSLARTLSFFPYFLAGYLVPRDTVDALRKRGGLIPVLCLAFALAVSVAFQKAGVSVKELFMYGPYQNMSGIAAVLVRLTLLVTGFVCIGGFVSAASDRRSIVSTIGRNSVLIYLLHSGTIRVLAKLLPTRIENGLLCTVLAAGFAAVFCLLIGSDPLAKLYRAVMTRITDVLLKKTGS